MLVAAVIVLELWRAPPGWLLPEHHTDVRVLHWLHSHWLNAAAIAALASMAAALTPLLIWLRDRRRTQSTPGHQARDREVMLHRVHRKWITDVLEPSLEHAARLTLGLQTRPDVLHIAMRVTRGPDRQPEPIPEGKPVLEVFEEAGSSLLILGAPGAGKTTLLLQLANALIDRAGRDPVQPIPVVVNLESWPTRRQALDQWLADELLESYGVPKSTANSWMADGELVLLLDGLDEVAEHYRPACAAAINGYRRDHGLNGLVVCSRTKELQQLAVELELDAAVELQPPTNTQVNAFLDHLENTGTPLTEVRAAIATDESLRELLSSPLMLNVIALAYHGREPTALVHYDTYVNRRAVLWEAYVKRMFEQRPLPRRCHYTPEQAVAWLGWLAHALEVFNENEFRLDRLTKRWLPIAGRRHTGPWLRGEHWMQVVGTLDEYVARVSHIEKGEKGETFGWDVADMIDDLIDESGWFSPGIVIAAAGAGLAAGLMKGVAAGLVSALATMLCAYIVGIFLLTVISMDLRRRWIIKRTRRPHEGIRREARQAMRSSLAAFLLFGAPAALGFWLGLGPALGLSLGLSLGLWFGVLFGVASGGEVWLQHYAVRAALARSGAAPWRLESFLDAMAERLLLRRSGGSYQFIHRLLRDYLFSHNPVSRETAESH
jgi:hypothetical protein